MRLSTPVKSSICKCDMWRVSDSTFYLMVPNKPETDDLREYLRKKLDPMATYFRKGAGPAAWQWALPAKEYRSLWVAYEAGRD